MGYIFMSLLTASVALSVGELSAFMPATGGFIRHTTKFVQPALGAAIGWNYCNYIPSPCFFGSLRSSLFSATNPKSTRVGYMMAVTGPAELSAAATLIEFWHPNVSPAVWYTVFIVAIFMINLCGVRIYGEVRK